MKNRKILSICLGVLACILLVASIIAPLNNEDPPSVLSSPTSSYESC